MQSGTTNAALNQAQSAENSALSDLNMAKADYVRYEELASTGAVSVQAFEQQRNRCQVAEAAYAKAQATT
jgi:multidrug resistance efflux pump